MFEKHKTNKAIDRLLEERLYELSAEEVERGEIRKGIYAKALALSEGDETKANAMYIQLRVETMKDEAQVVNAIASELSKSNNAPPKLPKQSTSPPPKVPELTSQYYKSGTGCLVFLAAPFLIMALGVIV